MKARAFVIELRDRGGWTVFEVNAAMPAIPSEALVGWSEVGSAVDPFNAPAAAAAAIEDRIRSAPNETKT